MIAQVVRRLTTSPKARVSSVMRKGSSLSAQRQNCQETRVASLLFWSGMCTWPVAAFDSDQPRRYSVVSSSTRLSS